MWARIEDEKIVEITDHNPEGRFHRAIKWVECPAEAKPGWRYEQGQCLPPRSEPIENLADRKRTDLERARDTAIDAGFTHTFGETNDVVQTRQRDRENLTGLAVSAQRHTQQNFYFRAKSNATYQLTAEEMLALADAAQAHVSQQYAKSWQLKAQLDAALEAEDRDALEAISW